MEPGRFIVGNAGVLLTRVLYRKHSGGKEYVVADAGMTELLRPSHYDAYHRIERVQAAAEQHGADVVGPVCESGDFLALDREMDDVAPGDLLAVFDAGRLRLRDGVQLQQPPRVRPRCWWTATDSPS